MDAPRTVLAAGSPEGLLSEDEIRRLLEQAFSTWDLRGRRLLVLLPDSTRRAPIPLFFRLFHELLHGVVARLDYLIALGTHPLMSAPAVDRLVGVTARERRGRYAGTAIYSHRWDRPDSLATLGVIRAEETLALSQGRLALDVPVRLNRLVLDYDLLLACGPVFPHEVAGFSGGDKYFFPGISGPDVINFTHWLGALLTSYAIIGTPDTPVRTVIERAAAMIPTPRLCCCLVTGPGGLHGLFIGDPLAAWSAAAALSAQVHIRRVERPFRQVVSVLPRMYADMWTGAKGMYKLEPVVADGGEVILYAPHITEISYTHGRIIDQVGYHVRDYFVEQWERFKDYPWAVLAHSTHLRGLGTFESGLERPRIQVTLATGIPPGRCQSVNLGYRQPASLRLDDFAGREDEGLLLVPQAGEILYRLRA